MPIKNGLMKLGKGALTFVTPDTLDRVVNKVIDDYQTLVKIPDLQDVRLEEAESLLQNLQLSTVAVPGKPHPSFHNVGVGRIVETQPKPGTKAKPGSVVKLYVATDDVLQESQAMADQKGQEVLLPKLEGLPIEEAIEDLEDLGLKATPKEEAPKAGLTKLAPKTVTRVTTPDGKAVRSRKIHSKQRLWVVYVSPDTLAQSRMLQEEKIKARLEGKRKVRSLGQETKDHLAAGAQSLRRRLPFAKNRERKSDDSE